jgi:HEAT repeat protein
LDFAAQKMEQATKRSSGENLSKGIKKLIRQGRVVLLCDALDEALGSRRDLVLAELKNFLEDQAYQDVPIVITSRTREDLGRGLKGLTVFEIQDLNDEAVSTFIRAYKRPEHSEAEITQRLQNHRLLEPNGLGRNPFWLRLIVASGAFEGNKGQILNTAVDTLLAREWDEKPAVERSWRRVLPRDEQLEETKRALAFLGYWMSVGNLVAIEQDGVLMALEKGWLAKREQAGVRGLRPQDVLGLGRDAQVLVYDPGPIKFRHRLLQEFMTAWMLMVDERLYEKEIERCAQDTRWWETLFLLGGLLGTNSSIQAYNELVQRVLGNDSNDQRLFAAIGMLRCLENPPVELGNSVTAAFSRMVNVGEGLTEIQFAAAQELGRILGDEAANAFGILLRSPKRLAKIQGVKLLCGIRGKRTSELFSSALNEERIKPMMESETTTEILVAMGEEAIELLITILHDSNSGVRWRAADVLGKMGEPAVLSLIAALRDSNSHVREGAAVALGKIGDPRVVEPLLATLHDLDSGVRSGAALALGKIGDPCAVEPLIAALHDLDSGVRSGAAVALGRIGDSYAVEPLIAALHDVDSGVRSGAVDALGIIGDPAAAEPLITTLHDPNLGVSWHAAEALGKIRDPNTLELLLMTLRDQGFWVSQCAKDVLIKIGELAVPSLIVALHDSNSDVRSRAAEALGKIGDPRAVEPLIAILRDSISNVRWSAVEALENIGDSRAIEPLLIALCDPDLTVRLHAAKALGTIGDECVVESLITALHDWHPEVRGSAASALGKIGDPRALPELERVAREDKVLWGVAKSAREAAEKIRQRMAKKQKETDSQTSSKSEVRHEIEIAL